MKYGRRAKALALAGAVAAAGGTAVGATAPAEASSTASYAASICGAGYWPDSNGVFNLNGGTVYVSYNGYTDCAVLIKTAYVGTPTDTWVYVGFDDGSGGGYGGNGDGKDGGNFTTYAGPVYVDAPGTCIEVGGGTVFEERWWSHVLCG